MLLDIEHRFAFDYDAYISESFIELRVHPKTTGDQTVNSFVLSVGPPTRVHRFLDAETRIAARRRDAVLAQDFLGLIFVDFHWPSGIYYSRLRGGLDRSQYNRNGERGR